MRLSCIGARSAGDAVTRPAAASAKPSRCTSRSRSGVVSCPSHLNSSAYRGARSPGSASPASFSAALVLRTAIRRSCRNSVSMSRTVPSTLASMMSSSRSSTAASGRASGHGRRQRDVHVAAVVAGLPPGGRERHMKGRPVGRRHARQIGEQPLDPVGLGVVAAHRCDRQARRECGGGRSAAPRRCRP